MDANDSDSLLTTKSKSRTNKLGVAGKKSKTKKKKKKKVTPTPEDPISLPDSSVNSLNDPDHGNPDNPEVLDEEATEDDDSDSFTMEVPGGVRGSISEAISLRKSRLSSKQKTMVILGAAGIIFVAFFVCIGTGVALTEWRHWN